MPVTSRPAPARRRASFAAASSVVSALHRMAAALSHASRRFPCALRIRSSEPALAGSVRPARGGHASRFVLPVFAGPGGGAGGTLAGAVLLLCIGAFAALPAQAQTLREIPNLRVSPVMGVTDKLDVSWDAPTGTTVAYYAVQWKSGAQQYDDTRVIQNFGANPATTAQITGLTADTAHDVRVTAVGGFFSQPVARGEVAGTRTYATNVVTVAAGTSPVSEGTAAEFTVALTSAAPSGGVRVSLTVSEAANSDYVDASDEGAKTLDFAQGESSKTYSVSTEDDDEYEPDGSVTVTLTGANASYTVGSPSSAMVTVNDNEFETNVAPVFDAASYSFSLAENADGSTTPVSVGTVTATDANTGDFVSYSITAGNTGSVFAIGWSTGAITYTGSGENYESFGTPASAFTLTVEADDGVTDTDVTVTVAVTDDDTEAPGKPDAPTVAATANSTTSLDVTWTAPANAGPAITGYDLRYREGTTGDWDDGPQDQTGLTAKIGTLAANTSYQVQVRATNDEGDGAWSDSTTGTTLDAVTAADWQPAVSGEDNSIRVSWPKLVDATGYRVQWKTGSQDWSTAERVHTTDAAARGYAIRNLTVGTTYFVRVTGVGSAGDLKVSDELEHFTHGYQDAYADPAEGDARAIDVEWELVPGAAGYAVEWDVASSDATKRGRRRTLPTAWT